MFWNAARRRIDARLLRGAAAVAALCVAACSAETEAPVSVGVRVTDDAGREVRLAAPARRIVSLIPAGTETVVALGAADRLVGRTRYDLEPELAHLTSVGGGLDPSLEALAAARPDLVIAFETASPSPVRARLEEMGVAVFGMRSQDTTDIYRNISRIAALLGLEARGDSLSAAIRSELRALGEGGGGRRPTVVYLAEVEPPIVAGVETYIMQLVGVAGGEPVGALAGASGLWPQLSLEELVRQDPDVVMIPVHDDPAGSVERLRRAPGWREVAAVREGRIVTVDAYLANRPGPRIAETAARMRAALRPYLGGP